MNTKYETETQKAVVETLVSEGYKIIGTSMSCRNRYRMVVLSKGRTKIGINSLGMHEKPTNPIHPL